jgi:Holliday junction resolvase-like predicted endonuclease
MKIKKGSRHSKITGNFAENLILYWLSKYNFECANVDHTGIDIIARNPRTKELMGISVKSRSRSEGREGDSLTIDNENFEKARKACKSFNCIPYFAIVIDAKDKIYCFILSMKKLLKMFPGRRNNLDWKMRKRKDDLNRYYKDPEIKIFEFTSNTHRWWRKK